MKTANPSSTCVIGAGQSGLATAMALRAAGIPFDGYECGSRMGGLWRYNNDNGLSAAYQNLHTNTSKQRTTFSGEPMDADFPDFPHHSQMLAYLESFAERHGLHECFQYQQRVTRVTPATTGGWIVELASGERKEYAAVVVATGHNWDPQWAESRGSFSGEELHSFSYRAPEPYAGRKVLVVGLGVSGAEIASDCASVAQRVVISSRRGAHIIPKYVLDRPADHWINSWNAYIPFPIQRRLYALLIWLTRGSLSRWNYPEPDHRILEAAPTLSQVLLPLVKQGRVVMRPGIESVDGHTVKFRDGTAEDFDVLIHATGYKTTVPFLDPSLLHERSISLPYFHRVAPPHAPGLYFCGFFAAQGAAIPIVEVQSRWISELIAGTARLPPVDEMWTSIEQEVEEIKRRYPGSSNNRLQLDVPRYLRALHREMKYSRQRADRRTE